jgi:hypothetical protein
LLNDTFVFRRFALAASSARYYKYKNQIIVDLTLQRATPAVTRRKEKSCSCGYSSQRKELLLRLLVTKKTKTTFVHILSWGMINA